MTTPHRARIPMSPRWAEALHLADEEKLTNPQIAARMGISRQTAAAYLAKARHAHRDRLPEQAPRILELVSLGYSGWEIAPMVILSYKRVKEIIFQCSMAFDANNQAHLVRRAIEEGLITIPRTGELRSDSDPPYADVGSVPSAQQP